MNFMLAMHSDYSEWQRMTPDEARAFDDRVTAFNDKPRTAGAWVAAEGLDEPARTVRFAGAGSTVIDGPFADTTLNRPSRSTAPWDSSRRGSVTPSSSATAGTPVERWRCSSSGKD